MKPYFNLACALVAWAALVNLANAETQQHTFGSLPKEAFQQTEDNPYQFTYQTPGIDLTHYHSLLLAPVNFLDKNLFDQWHLLIADKDNPVHCYYRENLEKALLLENIRVVDEPGPGVARLRVAFIYPTLQAHASDEIRAKTSLHPTPQIAEMDTYLSQVISMGQLEDSLNSTLLAGGVDLINPLPSTVRQAPPISRLLAQIDKQNHTAAKHLSAALGQS